MGWKLVVKIMKMMVVIKLMMCHSSVKENCDYFQSLYSLVMYVFKRYNIWEFTPYFTDFYYWIEYIL